jgi:hypothetical protein
MFFYVSVDDDVNKESKGAMNPLAKFPFSERLHSPFLKGGVEASRIVE